MPTNDELYERAIKALDALFGDRSVPLSRTIERLEELQDELSVRLDTLELDRKRASGDEE